MCALSMLRLSTRLSFMFHQASVFSMLGGQSRLAKSFQIAPLASPSVDIVWTGRREIILMSPDKPETKLAF